jgi:hypothetical protein
MGITKLTTNGVNGTKYDIASADNYYMEPIATTLLGSSTATVTFSGIPNTYKHLQLRIFGRGDRAAGGVSVNMQFNGDTNTANYYSHYIEGNGSTAYAGAAANVIYIYDLAAASSTTSVFGAQVIDILDYANVYKFKTVRGLSGWDNNSASPAGQIAFQSGLWSNTAAITSISMSPFSGNFIANSRFSLYGIKG